MVYQLLIIDALSGERFVRNYEREIDQDRMSKQIEWIVGRICKEFAFQYEN